MNTFVNDDGFKNKIDLKQTILEMTMCYYPNIKMEKQMETRQEYREGCRESDIRSLISQESTREIIERYFNFSTIIQDEELRDYLIDKCVEYNFVDSEELR